MPLPVSGAQQMTLRRAPNVWAFVMLGGVVGIVVGILVGVLGAGNPQFTPGAVVLFMVSVFAIVGLGAGAVVALVLERISVYRAQDVTTEVVAEEARAEPAGEETRTDGTDDDAGTASGDRGDPAGPRADDGGPAGNGSLDDGGPADPRSSREG